MKPSNDSYPGHNQEHVPTALKSIFIAIYVILIIAAIFGNSLVIRAFYKFPSLRSASNTILVSLSVADIFTTVGTILYIANIIVGKRRPPLRMLCNVASKISLTFNCIIILHLALISVERFIAVKFALRYHTIVTNRRAVIASTVVWLWGIAVSWIFPQAIKAEGHETFREFIQALAPCADRRNKPYSLPSASVRGYLIFLVISLLVVPIVIILVSYSYIFTISCRQRRQILEEDNVHRKLDMKREMKGARTVAIVVGICLVSFVPLLVVLCLRFLTSTSIGRKQMYPVYLVASLNACWNPLIYCWRNENFRKSFKKLMKCNSSAGD
ncbi:hypothetical protein OS493_009945 [Desmophyllum pertusum]|uniref:G-protein coupled receptors family 1 profile domain-containing protein n=1 Tax=Desmophyllum pertusum TaxID=174260 RepID=A0A9W9YEC7_9CNID|nr:hypothetical protein OS493_009945 [Desmophyllum pertusum]